MSTTAQAERVVTPWPLARRAVAGLAQPGGRVMLERALDAAGLGDGDRVVELAPGLGLTTDAILARGPRDWVGVEPDALAAGRLTKEFGGAGREVVAAPVDATGLRGRVRHRGRHRHPAQHAGRPRPGGRPGRGAAPAAPRWRVALHEFTGAPGLARDREAVDDLASIGVATPSVDEWRETVEAAGLVVVGSLVGALAMPPQRDLMRRAGPAHRAADHASGGPRRGPARHHHAVAGAPRAARALAAVRGRGGRDAPDLGNAPPPPIASGPMRPRYLLAAIAASLVVAAAGAGGAAAAGPAAPRGRRSRPSPPRVWRGSRGPWRRRWRAPRRAARRPRGSW